MPWKRHLQRRPLHNIIRHRWRSPCEAWLARTAVLRNSRSSAALERELIGSESRSAHRCRYPSCRHPPLLPPGAWALEARITTRCWGRASSAECQIGGGRLRRERLVELACRFSVPARRSRPPRRDARRSSEASVELMEYSD